jgi:hypothetical protein
VGSPPTQHSLALCADLAAALPVAFEAEVFQVMASIQTPKSELKRPGSDHFSPSTRMEKTWVVVTGEVRAELTSIRVSHMDAS